MAVLPKLLHPAIVNERISRLFVVNTTLQTHFGMQSGGPNIRPTPSRRGSYDVFNDTRNVATASLPGQTSTTIARHPVGNVPFTIPRTAEKLPLLMEELNQLRALGGPVDGVDSLGEQYIMDQERVFKQRFTNLREFQVAAMLRGSYTYTESGNALIHDYSGGALPINYQIPSAHKTQLNMTGGGDIIGTSWDSAAAPLVRDVLAVNAAFEENVGRGLTDIWVSSVVWGHVITNTEVQNLAGSVNDPVQSFTRGAERHEFTATLRGCPWVTWHISDNGLDVGSSPSFTKLIPDDVAVFLTPVDSSVVSYYEAPEPVVDPVSMQMTNQFGEYYYHKINDDPVSYEFHGRFNGLPVLKVPKALAYGTVVF